MNPLFASDEGTIRQWRQPKGLEFLLRSLKKRFPERSPGEIHAIVEDVLEEMHPSRARTTLERTSIHLLKLWNQRQSRPLKHEIITSVASRS